MAKYLSGNYLEFPRIFWKSKDKKNNVWVDKYGYNAMSVNAKWLYVTLKEMEHKFTGSKNTENKYDQTGRYVYKYESEEAGWFCVSTEFLAMQSGLSESSVRRARAELEEYGLIRICKTLVTNIKTQKKWIEKGYHL